VWWGGGEKIYGSRSVAVGQRSFQCPLDWKYTKTHAHTHARTHTHTHTHFHSLSLSLSSLDTHTLSVQFCRALRDRREIEFSSFLLCPYDFAFYFFAQDEKGKWLHRDENGHCSLSLSPFSQAVKPILYFSFQNFLKKFNFLTDFINLWKMYLANYVNRLFILIYILHLSFKIFFNKVARQLKIK